MNTDTTKAAQTVNRDWDLRGVDIETRYAKFSSEPLGDEDILALGKARMVLPSASVADKLFLTHVSDCRCYHVRLADWALMVADGIAKAQHRKRNGKRYRTYCEGYEAEWGAQAALDGIALAMYGTAPSLDSRAEWFGIAPQTYRKIRDFVGGVAVDAITEFGYALEWAHGMRRDRFLDGRYEAIVGETLKVRVGEGYAIFG